MSNRSLIPISAHQDLGKLNEAEYFRLYERSLADPDGFWGEQGKRIDWIKPYRKICNASFTGDVSIRWYEDGTLNASYNCIDRHLAKRADQTAISICDGVSLVRRHVPTISWVLPMISSTSRIGWE